MLHSERDLITRIKDGDTRLFSVLVDEYSVAVYSLVVRIVGQKEDAEEVTQDVFLRAFESLHTFNFRSSFSTWLYRIACNCALSKMRRKRQCYCEIDESRLQAVSDSQADSLEDMIENQQQIEKLLQSIGRLSAEDRVLLMLYYYEECSIAECAMVTSLSENLVKVRLHRIRKKLYILLTDETK
jgi:RNA polymerase sigma-70 factor (ECF subfamily)